MPDTRVYTRGRDRYVLPGGVQQPLYEVAISERSSVTSAVKMLFDLHRRLRERHEGGGVVEGAATVEFAQPPVAAGDICFVPFFPGMVAAGISTPLPEVVARLPSYGLRLATPYETLSWYHSAFPKHLETDGVYAFGGCKEKEHALLISQFSCRIVYISGRRRPDCHPMYGPPPLRVPYWFSIATVVDVPVTRRANQHVRLYYPQLAKAA